MRCLAWDERHQAAGTTYDLAINLEDEAETAQFVADMRPARVFGACWRAMAASPTATTRATGST